jgi:hypothetical protein
MSYWERASDQQLKAIETFCCGKELLDLGGYDGSLGVHLLERGADRVINVDKENPFHSRSHPRLIKRNLTFAEFDKQYPTDQWATAILSWPINHDYGVMQILPILERCREVVYLGSNSGGTQCGTPLLWQYLVSREVHQHLEERNCSLIIYTGDARIRRMVREEAFALCPNAAEGGWRDHDTV